MRTRGYFRRQRESASKEVWEIPHWQKLFYQNLMWPAARKTADLSHGSLQLPRHPVTAVFGTVIKETSCILNVILRQRIKTKKTVRNVEYMAAGKYNVEIFVNNQLDAQFFFMYVYFYSLHVSGSHVPIIRRINCINTTSGVCHSV